MFINPVPNNSGQHHNEKYQHMSYTTIPIIRYIAPMRQLEQTQIYNENMPSFVYSLIYIQLNKVNKQTKVCWHLTDVSWVIVANPLKVRYLYMIYVIETALINVATTVRVLLKSYLYHENCSDVPREAGFFAT